MEEEKYKLNIEREFVRTNSKNELINDNFPEVFGNKKKNQFITCDDDNEIFKIITPKEYNIQDAYDKLEEITNVVIEELYKLRQNLWPFDTYKVSNKEEKLYTEINFSLTENFCKNQNIDFKNIYDTYKKITMSIDKNIDIISKIVGKFKIDVNENSIKISKIKVDSSSKCGIKKDTLKMFLVILFSGLEENKASDFLEEIEFLKSVNKKYYLKADDILENIQEFKNTTNNLDEKEIDRNIEKYKEEGHNSRYCLQNYKKLVSESVVIIKDAISRGIDYEILNEAKSIVKFKIGNKSEFVIEGNKTDRDSYIFPIITDDKFIAKQIMKENGLNVPKAILLKKNMDQNDIELILQPFFDSKLVVKPRNTNYGIGITVFSQNASKEQILKAIDYAFKFDDNVLIEEYVKGMEYRFLVIDGKCLSICHRRVASVVGDGKSSIKQLIEEKNKEPWHYLTATPVKMDEPVIEFLKLQGYDFETVLPKDKRVFLRTNSNCSTGGESIDMTDKVPDYFKTIAEKAAKAFNAKICGVDIIVEDFNKKDYAIIEINDNPGYSINEWPYEGKGQKIGIAILKLLNLI